MVAACAPSSFIRVTKSIVGDPLTGSGNLQKLTVPAGDPTDLTFAIVVEHVGSETADDLDVTITDIFDDVFSGTYDLEDNPDSLPTWTRTNANASTTTGVGNISHSVTLAPGTQVSWLVETTITPVACTSLVTNLVTVTFDDDDSCCGDETLYAYAQVQVEGRKAKLDPAKGWTAMEVLHYLLEGVDMESRVNIAKFINACGDLGTIVGFDGEGGDGVALPILDVFGDPTGLYGETSPGN